ncbi:MAG: amidohydrolase family protein, partial [Propionicimonas sp.]|nr:amidohydrolase family protein [Propionicimonas sp.]
MAVELLLRNARLVGGDPDPVDLLVRDGQVARIVAAGWLSAEGQPGETLDLDGRWLLPGLADRHVHLLQWAKASRRLDLSGAGSAAEVLGLVGQAVASGVSEVVGFGFRDGLWPDRPTVTGLDAVTGGVPVVLVSGDLHAAWLNSPALRRYGVAAPDGLIREAVAFAVLQQLDAIDAATGDRWVLDALRAAAARGVTSITDLEMEWGFGTWPRRAALEPLAARVEIGFYPADLDRAIGA